MSYNHAAQVLLRRVQAWLADATAAFAQWSNGTIKPTTMVGRTQVQRRTCNLAVQELPHTPLCGVSILYTCTRVCKEGPSGTLSPPHDNQSVLISLGHRRVMHDQRYSSVLEVLFSKSQTFCFVAALPENT